jgi:Concanavalin A-like lectin/glucanases superfamily/Bacterial Ig-like domain
MSAHHRIISKRAFGKLLLGLAVALAVTQLTAQSGNLNGHPVRLDTGGALLSWYTPQDRAYDQVMSLGWDFLLNRVPRGSNGYPYYYMWSAMLPDLTPTARNNNPGSMFPGFAESSFRYYPYSGNPAVTNLTRDVLTHYLANGITPSNWPWANVPFATGQNGSLTYGGDPDVDGVDVIQPDKVGMVGTAFVKYYLFSGDVRFRDAAINCANTLAARIRTGDASRSPWPFRVNARTQAVREEYSAHVIAPIELFDILIARGLGNVATYQTARQSAWNWMMQYPMANNEWANYFEDVFVGSGSKNHTQLIALETARYLLNNTDKDAQWETHVRGILTWVEQNFAAAQFGANAIKEQFDFAFVMGSHTSRYASINAMLFDKTGDTVAKNKAYRAFNWATYMAYTDGRIIDGPDVNQIWFTDGYGDYIRHFMDGIAAVPEWAPAGQTHLLGSTSIVRGVSYATANEVTYQTVDATATDSLRVAFTPTVVTVDGQTLAQRADLTQPGWTYNSSTGAVRVRRTSGTSVRIAGSGGGTTPPAVMSVTPTSGSVVAVNSTVTAMFNKDMDPATVTGSTFFVRAGTSNVAATVSYSTGTRTATLTPSSALAAGTSYTATVKGGATDPRVKDLQGTALASDYTWTFSTATSTPPPSGGLVGAWGFNEGSGTAAADASGNGNNGSITGATWTTSGRYGAALTFNGTSNTVAVNDSATLDLTNGMTLEAWVYPTTTSGWRTVLMKESTGGLAWTLYGNDNASHPSLTVNTGGADQALAGVQPLPANTWTFLTGTYDGATMRLYVNGTQVSSRAMTGNLSVTAGALRIGGNAVWGEYFAGRIDDVRIYNRALTAAEIQTDMSTPVSGGGTTPPPAPPSGVRVIR